MTAVRARAAIPPAERLLLESRLLEGLSQSEAEVSVLVVHACDDYGYAGWRLGALLAGLAGTGLAAGLPGVPAPVLLAAMALSLGAGLALATLDPIRRLLFSESLADRRAVARAERGFAEAGLEAADGAGLLVFVALLERRVLLLAGERISRSLRHDGGLAEVAETVAAGVRRGRTAEALREGLERCGKLLSARLPAPPRPAGERLAAVVLED